MKCPNCESDLEHHATTLIPAMGWQHKDGLYVCPTCEAKFTITKLAEAWQKRALDGPCPPQGPDGNPILEDYGDNK